MKAKEVSGFNCPCCDAFIEANEVEELSPKQQEELAKWLGKKYVCTECDTQHYTKDEAEECCKEE